MLGDLRIFKYQTLDKSFNASLSLPWQPAMSLQLDGLLIQVLAGDLRQVGIPFCEVPISMDSSVMGPILGSPYAWKKLPFRTGESSKVVNTWGNYSYEGL